MEKYPDTNGNGIPDAFENRLPIREILNPELIRLESIIENMHCAQADDDKFMVYVPPQKGVVLLEVKGLFPSRSAACLFRSREEISNLIYQLQTAATEAFSTYPEQ